MLHTSGVVSNGGSLSDYLLSVRPLDRLNQITTPTSSHPPDHVITLELSLKIEAAILVLQDFDFSRTGDATKRAHTKVVFCAPRGPHTSLHVLKPEHTNFGLGSIKPLENKKGTPYKMVEGAILGWFKNTDDTWSFKKQLHRGVSSSTETNPTVYCDAFSSIGYYPRSHNGCLI